MLRKSSTSRLQAVYEPSTAIYEASTGVDTGQLQTSTDCLQYHNSARDADIYGRLTQLHRVGECVSLAALIGCVYLTAVREPSKVIITAWLILALLFFAADPLRMLTRIQAPQLRAITAVDFALLIAAIYSGGRVWGVAIVFLLATVILSHFKNSEWLSAYNWRMTRTVEKALKEPGADKACSYWQIRGRRETISLLHDIGWTFSKDAIDSVFRSTFILGYWDGCRNNKRVKDLESHIAGLESLLDQANERIEEQHADSGRKEYEVKYYEAIEESQAQALQIKAQTDEIQRLQEQLQNLSVMHSDAVKTANRAARNLYADILDSELSIAKTAENLNVPRWKVEHTRKVAKLIESGCSLPDILPQTKLKQEDIEAIAVLVA